MIFQSPPFITLARQQTMLVNTFQVDICLLEYDIESYDKEMYKTFDVALPHVISNSVSSRQAEYLAGRLAAKRSLKAHGITDFDLFSGALRQPLWPLNFTGSISHTNQLAAAAVLKEKDAKGVGIDIESFVSDDSLAALIETIVTPNERIVLLENEKKLTERELMTLIFSAKESFFKAAFPQVNQYFGFEAVTVQSVDHAESKLCLRLEHKQSPELLMGQYFNVSFDYIDAKTFITALVLD